ncbi:hypothetical protein [Pseudomonas saudimassiliensis]|uniref:hypothetical protein n=1 Tax=Pseudomonas saudimassiliensis TaxID=1461581 RepID=UPI0005CA912F|nr:hypothetical protein [Pseudomonas saudimassiliensis]
MDVFRVGMKKPRNLPTRFAYCNLIADPFNKLRVMSHAGLAGGISVLMAAYILAGFAFAQRARSARVS